MHLRFLNLQFSIRTDRVQIFFCEVLTLQMLFVENIAVAILPGIFPDIVRNKIQGFLFAVTFNNRPKGAHQFVSGAHGYMDMAVDDAGHDEFSV